MRKSVSFIHAADFHFGAPFRGLRALSPEWSKRLLKAIPEAYDRLIDAALRNKVDFVVISGDMFDVAKASFADTMLLFRGFERLREASIEVYALTGNHDPLSSWQSSFCDIPENVHFHASEHPSFFLHRKEGEPLCIIAGRGYHTKVWPSEECAAKGITREAALEALGEEASRVPFAIGMLHTGLNLDLDKAPVTPKQLMQANMDYWALGHIHQRMLIPEEHPVISFSGCIQGRDIGETGQRGVNLVRLEEGRPNKVDFIPTASVVWQKVNVSVKNCSTIQEAVDKIVRDLFVLSGNARCDQMVARITLTGATSLHEALGKTGVLEDVRSSINNRYSLFFCDALKDKTTRPIDREALSKEGMFPATLMNVAKAAQNNQTEMLAYVQDAFLDKGLEAPESLSKDMGNLIGEAESLVLDLLAKEEDR